MLTDDPGTPGDGVWEINFAYLEERNPQERLRSFPHIDINYGMGDRVQLKYETGWVFAQPPDGGNVRSGLDDSLLGIKWRFLDQERAALDMSVYPQLQLENSTGSVSRGVAEPGPNLFLPLEAGHDFGSTKLIAELGYQISRARDNEWVAGVLGVQQVSDVLELMAEVRSYSEKLLDRGDVVLNAGLRRTLNPKVRLLASVGTGINNGADTPTFIAYLGIQLVLDRHGK